MILSSGCSDGVKKEITDFTVTPNESVTIQLSLDWTLEFTWEEFLNITRDVMWEICVQDAKEMKEYFNVREMAELAYYRLPTALETLPTEVKHE